MSSSAAYFCCPFSQTCAYIQNYSERKSYSQPVVKFLLFAVVIGQTVIFFTDEVMFGPVFIWMTMDKAFPVDSTTQ